MKTIPQMKKLNSSRSIKRMRKIKWFGFSWENWKLKSKWERIERCENANMISSSQYHLHFNKLNFLFFFYFLCSLEIPYSFISRLNVCAKQQKYHETNDIYGNVLAATWAAHEIDSIDFSFSLCNIYRVSVIRNSNLKWFSLRSMSILAMGSKMHFFFSQIHSAQMPIIIFYFFMTCLKVHATTTPRKQLPASIFLLSEHRTT